MRRTTVGIAAGIVVAAGIVFLIASCGVSTSPGRKTFLATLSPANEVPPKTSTGSGVATFVDLGNEIDWTLELSNITGVTASHIHGPAAAGTNASIIVNLFIPNVATGTLNGVVARGTITNANNASVSLDSLRTLINAGNAYVNIHTSANPAGEIRDQIRTK